MIELHSKPEKLGRGYTVEFSMVGDTLTCVWSPRAPYGRHLRQVLPSYQRARHRFLARLAEQLGTSILVADVSLGEGVRTTSIGEER